MRALHSLLKTLEHFIAGRLISTADMITAQLDNASTSKEQTLCTILCSISSIHLFYLGLQKLKFTHKCCVKMRQCCLVFGVFFLTYMFHHNPGAVSFDSHSRTVLAGTPTSFYFKLIFRKELFPRINHNMYLLWLYVQKWHSSSLLFSHTVFCSW